MEYECRFHEALSREERQFLTFLPHSNAWNDPLETSTHEY